MRKVFPGLVFIVLTFAADAQDSTNIVKDRLATGLRADGKIYVVMAVALTILAGLFIYLIRLDRKISRLENGSSPK
ncbi:MAG: CcmD family protein [Chitinophagaceae bacterium]|nr:CcmD family protein [Chitinophagaceae bacterium]